MITFMWHYQHKATGMVLVIVLLVIQLICLITWYVMENVLLQQKISQDLQSRHHLWYEAVSLLPQIENRIMTTNPACLISKADNLIKQPISWWQDVGCAGNLAKLQYYYVIEFLGSNPCAMVQKNGASFWRLTLFIRTLQRPTRLLLQSIVVKANLSPLVCRGSRYVIKKGRQQWREID
jgi:hypothetical protein